MKQTYKIGGMTCVACSSGLERLLKKKDGVVSVEVSFATETMDIEYNDNITFEEIENTVKSLGFYIVKDEEKEKKKSKFNLKLFKLIVSIITTVLLMYISMGHMIGLPLPNFLNMHTHSVNFAFSQFILSTIVVLLGYKFYVVGFRLLFKKIPNMDTLVAVGTSASYLYSVYSFIMVIMGHTEFLSTLYFESTATIITLVEVGRYLEEKSKVKTGEQLNKLINLKPKLSVVIRNGNKLTLKVDEILLNDIVELKTGERVPVDGEIIDGIASIDESMVTGESIPKDKTVGEKVIAGTILNNGYIKFKVAKIGSDTMIAHIIDLVKKAQVSKAPTQRITDIVSGYFTYIVLAIAIIATIVWAIIGFDFAFLVKVFVSVLVISCPCALGIATPVSVIVGTGKAASLGILFKEAEAIENLSKVDTVVFDKTGTLTVGKPFVTNIKEIDINKNKLLECIYAVEALSSHPLSLAIVDYAKEKNVELKKADSYMSIIGKGIYGKLDGKEIYIGNEKLIYDLKIDITKHKKVYEKMYNDGSTVMFVVISNKLSGIIAVSDIERKESKELIKKLTNKDIKTYMLTGDIYNSAKNIGKKIGIKNIKASMLPEDKTNFIKDLIKDGKKVAMVGDGINDSPALTTATVGIAISSGTDIATNSANVVLMKNDIYDVYNAIMLSKYIFKVIKENLFWAFFYNAICIPIACGVLYPITHSLISPMFAALAMSLSSISVILNALRINLFKTKNNK